MFPYFWGGLPVNLPNNTAYGLLPLMQDTLRDLPEEVRQGLEDRQNEIHSAADVKDLVNELELRR